MENKPLPSWIPNPRQIQEANLTSFMAQINMRHETNLFTFDALHQWSIHHLQEFWRAVWDFCGLITSQKGKRDVHFPQGIFKPQFFSDAHLNYAENLLRPHPLSTPTLIFWGEDKVKRTLTFGEVYQEVAQLTAFLKSLGIQKGDRVVGYVPNT